MSAGRRRGSDELRLVADLKGNPDHMRCRVLRHALEVVGEHEANGSRLVVLECTSCGTRRYDRWNTRTGERWGNPSYSWPAGYQDKDHGHDLVYWRKVYAEHLFGIGVLEDAPFADTRKKSGRSAG